MGAPGDAGRPALLLISVRRPLGVNMTHIYQRTMIIALVAFALFAGALTVAVALPGSAGADSAYAASAAVVRTPAQVCLADSSVTASADTAAKR